MFATFKMSPNFFDEKSLEKYYENGIRLYDAQKRMVNQSLDQYLSIDGVLKAVEIEPKASSACPRQKSINFIKVL